MTPALSSKYDTPSFPSAAPRNGDGAKSSVIRSDRPAVVLLHSSAASARQWDRLAERLVPNFEVHAIDLHGHGRQAPWRGQRPLSAHDDAALALSIIEQANGAHVIGHSYGATVALQVAAECPSLVRSLAIFEPVLFGLLAEHEPQGLATREAFDVADAVRLGVAAGQAPAAAEQFVRYWSGERAWERLSARQQQSIIARMPVVAQHFDVVCAAALPAARLAQLTMPMLCLTGGRTTVAARRIGSLLRVMLPAARHETVEEVGHLGPITHPEVVNQHLFRFLAVESSRLSWATASAA